MEQRLAIQTRMARIGRLDAVAYPMWTRGSALCGDHTGYSLWARFDTLAQVQAYPDTAQAVLSVLPIAPQPTVVSVTRGGPASQAGLMPGDVVTALNGVPVGEGVAATRQLLKDINSTQERPVRLQITRGAASMEVVAAPVLGCTFGIRYIENDGLNAFSDGASVNVLSGMIRFVESDDELAMVMGHELAHNAEGHIQLQKQDARSGKWLDILAAMGGVNTHGRFARRAALRYSQQYENEADYVGLYFMALGGYAIDGTPDFWRRMAVEHPANIKDSYQATHPSTPARFTALEKTVAEIHGKSAAGLPLTPDTARRNNQLAPPQPAAPEASPSPNPEDSKPRQQEAAA